MGRNSNIELLRILAMFAIVSGHLVAVLPVGELTGVNQFGANMLGSGLRIAVNLFVMIGAWFLVDARFRFERVLRLYLATACYSVLTIVFAYAFGNGFPLLELVRHVLPFWGANFWFVTVYIMLLLLAPFLNGFFRLPRKAQAFSLLLVGVFCVFYATCPYPQHGSMERFLGWFAYLYLLMGFLKRSMMEITSRYKGVLLAVSVVVYLALVMARCRCDSIEQLAYQYTYDVVSLPNFLCAVTLFLGVIGFLPRENKLVNMLARPMLGVYLAHGAFACLYLDPVGRWLSGLKDSPLFLCALGFCAGMIFLLSAGFDILRIRLLDGVIRQTRFYKKVCGKVDAFYAEFL